MGAFEKSGHVRCGVGAHEPVVGSVVDAHLLQTVEIAQQLLPFRCEAGLAGEVVEMHNPPNCGVHGRDPQRVLLTSTPAVGCAQRSPRI